MSKIDETYQDAVRRSQAAAEVWSGQHRISEEHQRQIAEEMQRVLDKERAGVKRLVADLPNNERTRIEKTARQNMLRAEQRHLTRVFRGKTR